MGRQNHHVVLLLDNFSGHYISYEPQNIDIQFFEPNLTSFVQPCDASIIQCLKAHYQKAFCLCAIGLDEAGEQNIYKVSILEAMLLVQEAWDAVSQETIKHCWNHTKIQSMKVQDNKALGDSKAWDILHELVASDMTLPQAETKL
ncbi:hypothetical protein M422DRAFT_50071 [Sphaerobolus stellatus SS14]|uniref:DDE-1 domain-containing protein n=1 Tax=Sphaerobolus stellatus (strain SS14) TaxID=990650 RepID=A0A0C9UU62_SPHS4|nr:hypothetical protein M422DRAFT_50071 [Sphaerobolus stellatus SS14]